MSDFKLTEVEEELVNKYQLTKDNEIALYFFNKIGRDLLNIIYSKVTLKFSNIPFEKEDLTSIVWKGIKDGLECWKHSDANIWTVWYKKIYERTLKEIKKYFKNGELILNYANSWDQYQNTHIIFKNAPSAIEKPRESFSDLLKPIVDYVVAHNNTYNHASVQKLLLLKSFGYSEREIAEKMHVSRRYIASMIKIILRISKRYFKH